MAGLGPYPTYRDSSVPWLGEVPDHWEVRRLGTMTSVVNGATPSSGTPEYWDGDIPWITPEDLGRLSGRSISDTDRKITSDGYLSCGTRLAPQGSIAISTRAPIGHMAILNSSACSNQGCRLLVPRRSVVTEWLYFALVSVRTELAALGQGTTFPELSRARLRAFPLPAPCLSEQAAIARFLEHADRRIQQAITAKEKRVALLEEKKQAVIHQAVTGQIDVRNGKPYPDYKHSGTEWVNAVPEHWTVTALRHRYSQCLGKMLDTKKITGVAPMPYLRNTDVQWDRINCGDLPVMDIYPKELARYTVEPGDLLVCEGGEIGRCAIWQGEIACCGFQKALHRLRPLKATEDRPRFLLYAIWAAASGGAFRDGHQTTIGHLTGEKLRTQRFGFPPIREQVAIADHIDQMRRRIDSLVESQAKLIEGFHEFRTRLIADVVTGKLDVREVAAALPDTPAA